MTQRLDGFTLDAKGYQTDKIVCFPGQLSFRIRQGKERKNHPVLMEFGLKWPEYNLYPKGLPISRWETAVMFRKLRAEMRKGK